MNGDLEFVIVIPARFGAQRFPGKLLTEVDGRTLLEWTWRRARDAGAAEVVVAFDDERIGETAAGFGADTQHTSTKHRSGSDRIAECARLRGWPEDRIIVNLQGDEPLMPPACLRQVARLLQTHAHADAATLFAVIGDPAEVDDPNVVKVVVRHDASALYFSRAPIPAPRDFDTVADAMAAGMVWRRHLGLYAYRHEALSWFAATPPTPLEDREKLEQLRFLEFGKRILLARARAAIPPGVDTPTDLERVRDALERPA